MSEIKKLVLGSSAIPRFNGVRPPVVISATPEFFVYLENQGFIIKDPESGFATNNQDIDDLNNRYNNDEYTHAPDLTPAGLTNEDNKDSTQILNEQLARYESMKESNPTLVEPEYDPRNEVPSYQKPEVNTFVEPEYNPADEVPMGSSGVIDPSGMVLTETNETEVGKYVELSGYTVNEGENTGVSMEVVDSANVTPGAVVENGETLPPLVFNDGTKEPELSEDEKGMDVNEFLSSGGFPGANENESNEPVKKGPGRPAGSVNKNKNNKKNKRK